MCWKGCAGKPRSQNCAAGILFLLTLISGLIVSNSSRLLNVGLVTILELITVGTMVLIGVTVNQLYKTADGKLFIGVGMLVVSGNLFLALIAIGALLTREEMQLPAVVLSIHQVAPLPALVSSAATLYLFASSRS